MNRLLIPVLVLAACTSAPPGGTGSTAPADQSPITDPSATDSAMAPADSIVTINGTVQQFDLEGGFFAIRGDDGTTYDPRNLAEEFRQDGLPVRARLRLLPSMGGIHMVGPIVDIVEISKRGP